VKRRWDGGEDARVGGVAGAGAAVGREGPIAQDRRLDRQRRGAARPPLERAAQDTDRLRPPRRASDHLQRPARRAHVRARDRASSARCASSTSTLIPDRHHDRRSVVSRGLFGSPPGLRGAGLQPRELLECFTYAALGVVPACWRRRTRALPCRRRVPAPPAFRGRPSCSPGSRSSAPWTSSWPGNISDGYEVMNDALAGRLPPSRMAVLALAKIAGSNALTRLRRARPVSSGPSSSSAP